MDVINSRERIIIMLTILEYNHMPGSHLQANIKIIWLLYLRHCLIASICLFQVTADFSHNNNIVYIYIYIFFWILNFSACNLHWGWNLISPQNWNVKLLLSVPFKNTRVADRHEYEMNVKKEQKNQLGAMHWRIIHFSKQWLKQMYDCLLGEFEMWTLNKYFTTVRLGYFTCDNQHLGLGSYWLMKSCH